MIWEILSESEFPRIGITELVELDPGPGAVGAEHVAQVQGRPQLERISTEASQAPIFARRNKVDTARAVRLWTASF